MAGTSITEKEILLILFKDFSTYYNPSNISGKLKKTRMGAYNSLKSLEASNLVRGENIGRARFYTVNLKDEYEGKKMEILLMEEAKKFQRWKDEFKELYDLTKIVIMFGSAVRDEKKAADIDLLLVFDSEQNDEINRIIKEKNDILIKRIHPVKQTMADIKKNILKNDKIILEAIKTGVVLSGYEKMVELIKDVTCKK